MLKISGTAAVVIALLLASFPSGLLNAAISTCTTSVSPGDVDVSTTTDFSFTITNSDVSNSVQWVKIKRPSANFTINSGSGAVVLSLSSSEITFGGFSIGPGGGHIQLSLNTTAGPYGAPPANWIVQASDNSNGGSPTACNGDLSTAITGDTSVPVISNVSISGLTNNSATISWATDEPATSQVEYGPDEDYEESTSEDNSLKTSHSVNVTGLSANTAYHYQIVSRDAVGNEAVSSDNTFLTPLVDPVISDSQPLSTKIPLKTTPTEFIPPTIKLNTSFAQPFKKAPKITGEAGDNEMLAGIEYSTDGGQNWLPVDEDTGLGAKKATFSFTPLNFEDGNYQLIARAIDTSGNIGKTGIAILVIDRLPPLVGGNIIALGPLVLEPDKDGLITTMADVDQKITLSAVGGPTEIVLRAKNTKGQQNKEKLLTLTKSADTGLWSGILSFEQAGTYSITADSLDGAGNKTSRGLNTIRVSKPARVLIDDQPVQSAKATLYYLETDTNSWVVWGGVAYGQDNPQTVDDQGGIKLFMPSGKYYLKVTADGYQPVTTDIFEADKPTPLSVALNMKSAGLKLGPLAIGWPSWSTRKVDIKNGSADPPATHKDSSLVGKILPSLNLTDSAGGAVSSISWLGRPTLLTATSTWVPDTADQLAALAELQKNEDLNIVSIALQENYSKVRAYSKIAGYELSWLADTDGVLADPLNIQSLPTHYFIDRHGTVKKIISGLLSKEELLTNISVL